MDPTCIDVSGNLDVLGLVLAPRLALFLCDLLRDRSPIARRISDALGTILGGRHERYADTRKEES